MKTFIYTQYNLYKAGAKSISLEKIQKLAELYLTEEEKNKLFS